jgi:hypothetical protein
LRLSRCFELGLGRRLRLRFQFGLGLADPLGTPLLVGDPIRHLVAGLVATVQLVLLGVRRRSRAEPLGDLGFQFRGALLQSARSRSRRECDGFLVAFTLGHHGPRHPCDLVGE